MKTKQIIFFHLKQHKKDLFYLQSSNIYNPALYHIRSKPDAPLSHAHGNQFLSLTPTHKMQSETDNLRISIILKLFSTQGAYKRSHWPHKLMQKERPRWVLNRSERPIRTLQKWPQKCLSLKGTSKMIFSRLKIKKLQIPNKWKDIWELQTQKNQHKQ